VWTSKSRFPKFLEVTTTERIMLKYILLASAMTISAPVLAQEKPAATPTAPVTQADPAQTTPATPPTANDLRPRPRRRPRRQSMKR
jgi:hypothetical protein